MDVHGTTPAPPKAKRARCRNARAAVRFHTEGDHASQSRSVGQVPRLPRELLVQVFRSLSAQDLTVCCATCRCFREAADDESLWRRLYCARWGQFEGCESKVLFSHFWKATYMQRDSREYSERVLAIQDETRPMYHAMQVAQRSICVRRDKEPSWSQQTSCWQEQVAAFCRMRGLPGQAGRPQDMSTAVFIKFGDVFVDERSGWMHVCDDSCTDARLDDNGFRVCGLTGRVHGQALCDFGDGRPCDDVPEALAEDLADADFQTGWLGRAFVDGYTHESGDQDTLVTEEVAATSKRKRRHETQDAIENEDTIAECLAKRLRQI